MSHTLTGIVNQNVDPTSTLESTPMVPPSNLTNCREIDKPKPVPPKRRVEELSTCWKGTNSVSVAVGDRPMPVSLIAD